MLMHAKKNVAKVEVTTMWEIHMHTMTNILTCKHECMQAYIVILETCDYMNKTRCRTSCSNNYMYICTYIYIRTYK